MERVLKERLFGTAIIIAIGVLLVPSLLEEKKLHLEKGEAPAMFIRPKGEETLLEQPQLRSAAEEYVKQSEALATSPDFSTVAQKLMVEEEKHIQSQETTVVPTVPAQVPVAKTEVMEQKTQGTEQPSVPLVGMSTTTLPENAAVWSVQLGTFSNRANADSLVKKLKAAGFKAYAIHSTSSQGPCMKVFVGPEAEKRSALAAIPILEKRFQLKGILVRYQPGAI